MWLKSILSRERRSVVIAVVALFVISALVIPNSGLPAAWDSRPSPIASSTPETLAARFDALEVPSYDQAPTASSAGSPTPMAEPAITALVDEPPSATPEPTSAPLLPTPTVAEPTPLPTATPEERLVASRGGRQTPEATVGPEQSPPLAGKRVGLQVGHWKCDELPAELASLRRSTGGSGGGYREVDVNLKVARLVADILDDYGIQVDVLPATVPPKYKADAFVAIHADANNSSAPRGFKAARSNRSSIPTRDDALVKALYAEYLAATGLPRSSAITNNMLYYYAFSGQGTYTVASTTPSAIVEMGYLTNPLDRALMVNSPNVVASGIARGILRFLNGQ
ncbi:MAG: N-acetylmuramoyl-L-alanine amidase [Chloroflexota bacterium]